jgi:hypothetical protein
LIHLDGRSKESNTAESWLLEHPEGALQPDPLRELVSACRLVMHGDPAEKIEGRTRLKLVLPAFDGLEV